MFEAGLEAAEGVADIVVASELIAAIPVVGTAVKVCSALDDIRSRSYLSKLRALLEGLGDVPSETLDAWKDSLGKRDEELQKAGEMTFLLVERLAEVDKAVIVGTLLRALVEAKINGELYMRLALAVDGAFLADLTKLLDAHKVPELSDLPWMKYLANVGLTEAAFGIPYGGDAVAKYSVSKLGHQFRTAYQQGRAAIR